MRAISMEEAKAKLRNLKEHLPDCDEVVWKFGAFLADRLNPELVPEGFSMAVTLALYDLEQGIDGYSGEPIRSSLVGYPPQIYALLNMYVPEIAEAVLPEDFAAEVRQVYEDMFASLSRESEGT